MRIYAFAPVISPAAKTLILGSMPSVKSLADDFYYAHPRNAFWPIMADILREAPPTSTAEKVALLLKHDIALWDVLASCERDGSLDSGIKLPEFQDFSAFFLQYPSLDRLLFNGGTAHRLFMRRFAQATQGKTVLVLPSTSPAYTISYEKKRAAWHKALKQE